MTSLVLQSMFVVCVLLTAVSCQKPLVSIDVIKPDSPFSVHCDASRLLNPENYFNDVWGLYILRKTANDITEDTIAKYENHGKAEADCTSRESPKGGRWRFHFNGNNNGKNNRDTMQIVWDIIDTRCEDAGVYVCRIYSLGLKGGRYNFKPTQKVRTINPCVNPLVWPKPIEINKKLHIDCDSSRFSISENEIFSVSTLTVYRDFGRNKDYPIAAQYISEIPPKAHEGIPERSNSTKTMIPIGRSYQFKFSGAKPAFASNKNMSIEWTILDTKKEDVGTFNCDMEYFTKEYKLKKLSISELAYIDYKHPDPYVVDPFIDRERLYDPIIWPKPIETNKTLHIYCDASRFHIPENDIFSVSTLTVYRDFGMNKDYPIAAQFMSEIPHKAHKGIPARSNSTRTMIPPRRNYQFTFSGAKPAFALNKNMSIEWTILDTKYEDVGTFSCDMEYFTKNYKLKKLSRNEFVYIDLKHADLLPILSVGRRKGYFNITCDARRARFPAEHIKVTGILETRITVAFDKMQPSGVASHKKLSQEVWTDVCDMIRSGRKWEVIKGDYRDNYVNIDTASTKVIVHDASCDDAGTYRCDIVYRDPQSKGLFHKLIEKQRLSMPCQ